MTPPTAEPRALVVDGLLEYGGAVRLQEALWSARSEDRIPDVVLFLQHSPVVTLGRRGRDDALLWPRSWYARQGISLVQASRGGDVTYHGPGQWVIYPIVRLDRRVGAAHGYLHNLEQVAIDAVSAFGVEAFRVAGKSGAWTASGKIAAIGFRLRRGVTMHGMSLNVEVDLAAFSSIRPCGLSDPVASLSSVLGDRAPTMQEVLPSLQHAVGQHVVGRSLRSTAIAPEVPENPAPWLEHLLSGT